MPPAKCCAYYSFVIFPLVQPLAGEIMYGAVHVAWHVYACIHKDLSGRSVYWAKTLRRRKRSGAGQQRARQQVAELEDLKGLPCDVDVQMSRGV